MKMKREKSKKPKADPMERSTDKPLVKLTKKKKRREDVNYQHQKREKGLHY